MARAYAGTVMLEGATLSEGRGTTRPLELFGAPDIDARDVIAEMHATRAALAEGLQAARMLVRADLPQACEGQLCHGVQIHCEAPDVLRSRGVQAVARAGAGFQGDPAALSGLRAVARFSVRVRVRQIADRCDQRLAAACANGWTIRTPTPADLDAITVPDEQAWASTRAKHLLY